MTSHVESYEQAIEFLFSRVNFERLTAASYSTDDFKLDRMKELLRRLGDPHLSLPAIHIAGTKGKGSTAALIAGITTAAGWKTGLFTSPHISAFEERLAVDGRLPTQSQFVELVTRVSQIVAELDKTPGRMSPTYFEIATALAWLYFSQSEADLGVMEVGMGGRLDSTNICQPAVCIVTTISRDHTRHLGSRIEQIAREKAGIIKHGVPVISGVMHPAAQAVIQDVCREQEAPLVQLGRDFDCRYQRPQPGDASQPQSSLVDVITGEKRYERLPLPLVGEHQARNAAVAIAAVEQLDAQGWRISDEAIRDGLARVRWPGRIELVDRNPTVIVDTAHNWEAISALVRTLDESFPSRRRVLVFAAARDKDVAGMLRLLLPCFDSCILTHFSNNPRNVPTHELVRLARSMSDLPVHAAADAASAWKLARRLATADDLICVTGSFFIAAELRELILDASCRNETSPAAGRQTGW